MMIVPAGVKVHLTLGYTDMRKGIGRACRVGPGAADARPLLGRGGFVWPRMYEPGGAVTLSPAQLAMLIEGIDWRSPERVWRPARAG